jgi:hypothetical protein
MASRFVITFRTESFSKEIYMRLKILVLITLYILCFSSMVTAEQFQGSWPKDIERVWVGPEYWANRLQDWRISQGRLECVEARAAKPLRTVHLLTHRLAERPGEFAMSVRTGIVGSEDKVSSDSAAGFLIGAAPNVDYRAAALVHHSFGPDGGIIAVVESGGRVVFRDMTDRFKVLVASDTLSQPLPEEVELSLQAEPTDTTFKLNLKVCSAKTKEVLGEVTLENVAPARLVGNVALVSHPGTGENTAGFWFDDFKVGGDKFEFNRDHLCGPVICTQYTLSRNILKMTAQMMPIGQADTQTVTLQIKQKEKWQTIAKTKIIAPGFTAPFRIENWDSTKNTPYRLVYDLVQTDGSTKPYYFSGTIRRDPVDKETIVLAGFTGNHNVAHPGLDRGSFSWVFGNRKDSGAFPWTDEGLWFPHNDIVANVLKHKPDVLFFSGDQVYESASPTGAVRKPLDEAMLDYLYKWYLWCWAYRDMTKDIPSVCIPDDHDVYQGNLWGAGGRRTNKDNKGGYVMPAEFVKMSERTQTSHLPDPYDPAPIEQGIGVYYCAMNYGRIDFAILEDRKFKSGPAGIVPKTKSGRDDHVIEPDYYTKTADVPGAKLLGDRQLKFLKEWAADWRTTDMKAALSQTIFAGMATHHGHKLDYLRADFDTNGWPQSGRNKALHELRRCFAFMVGGDQHLSTVVHHGIDDWGDAGWSFCVPSVANFYPRAWWPKQPGKNRRPGMPEYTGEFLDGLGNHVTVYAATNPGKSMGKEPAGLHDNMPGYGIVKFNKDKRTITIQCWLRYADPYYPSTGGQYEGWPITISQIDNYDRKPIAFLPTINVSGMTDPVVQVIDQSDSKIVYTLRINGNSFDPKVFREGKYTIKVGEPDTGQIKTFRDVQSVSSDSERTIEVRF